MCKALTHVKQDGKQHHIQAGTALPVEGRREGHLRQSRYSSVFAFRSESDALAPLLAACHLALAALPAVQLGDGHLPALRG